MYLSCTGMGGTGSVTPVSHETPTYPEFKSVCSKFDLHTERNGVGFTYRFVNICVRKGNLTCMMRGVDKASGQRCLMFLVRLSGRLTCVKGLIQMTTFSDSIALF